MKNFDKFDLLLLILGIGGLLAFVTLHQAAFPSASLEVEVSKEQAQEIADKFVLEQGLLDPSEYQTSIILDEYTDPFIYVQYFEGVEGLENFNKEIFPLWTWHIRYFKPHEIKELSVFVDVSSGQVSSYAALLPEDEAGDDLSREQAQSLAEDFAKETVAGFESYKLVTASTEKQANRTDHLFEWDKEGYQFHDADLRVSVSIAGDKISFYTQTLVIPENFLRDIDAEAATGNILVLVFQIASMIFLALAVIVLFRSYKKGNLDWRFGLVFGIVAVVAEIILVVNLLPTFNMSYPTNIDPSSFYLTAILISILGGLLTLGSVLVVASSGKVVSTEAFGDKAPILSNFVKRKILGGELVRSSLRGYLIAFAFLGYQAIFYVIARSFLPVYIPASPEVNSFGTILPFLAAIPVGILTGLSEEFEFRFFSLSFLKRYVKSTLVALLIPAIIWGFLHSNYPIFPIYLRGVELTIAGVLFGLLFMRFNIETLIIAHFVFNSLLGIIPLLKSKVPVDYISGILIIAAVLVPLVVGFLNYKERPRSRRKIS